MSRIQGVSLCSLFNITVCVMLLAAMNGVWVLLVVIVVMMTVIMIMMW